MNGHAMRESWIMNPETISARDLKQFDAMLRTYAAARMGPSDKKAKLKPVPYLSRNCLRTRKNALPSFVNTMMGVCHFSTATLQASMRRSGTN